MRRAPEAEALWFGPSGGTCFGMLHEPDVVSHRGVVLCNTLGFEGMITYRALRHLADDLAKRGFWGLRFDYAGEGDSAGGPWEPDRVAAWTRSIDDAVGVLHSRGVTEVYLVGIRAGALLAQVYATSHPGISGVVLWWPCVSGSAFVRELRALSRLSAAARPPQRVRADYFPADSLEVSGFEFAAPTLADLAQLDLVATPAPLHAPAALIIERIDAPPNDLLLRKLADVGVDVADERFPGYAEFMTDDAVTSVLPTPILQRITDWLDTRSGFAPPDREPGEPARKVSEHDHVIITDPLAGRSTPDEPARDRVVETPEWVDDRLFAIMSSPAGREPIRRVAILCCTIGANNRAGPGRLHVSLARYWASLGFTVFRVDLGGVGESLAAAPDTENQPHAPVRRDEICSAIPWVRRKTGFDDVVLFGLCSGAYNAFQATIDGATASHLILVNPGVFYPPGTQALSSTEARLRAVHALGRGLTSPRKWRLVLREQGVTHGVRRIKDLLRAGAAKGAGNVAGAVARNTARRVGLRVKAPTSLTADLEHITARGAKVLMVFSAGESSAHYVRMFAGTDFDKLLGDGVKVVGIDGGDHVFSSPGARQKLFEEATTYLEREFRLELPPEPVTVPGDGRMSANDA